VLEEQPLLPVVGASPQAFHPLGVVVRELVERELAELAVALVEPPAEGVLQLEGLGASWHAPPVCAQPCPGN